jgi:hypothetical protein
MAIAAGPFPLPSPPWQEAQYFTNVCLPDPALVCFTAGSCSFFPSARTMPRATASTAPERITLNVDIGSFSRFARVDAWGHDQRTVFPVEYITIQKPDTVPFARQFQNTVLAIRLPDDRHSQRRLELRSGEQGFSRPDSSRRKVHWESQDDDLTRRRTNHVLPVPSFFCRSFKRTVM